MTTFTEIVAAVVVHSSTVALGHFGVTLEPAQCAAPAPTPVVARSPRRPDKAVVEVPAPRSAPVRSRA